MAQRKIQQIYRIAVEVYAIVGIILRIMEWLHIHIEIKRWYVGYLRSSLGLLATRRH